jgi:hypothetical protein
MPTPPPSNTDLIPRLLLAILGVVLGSIGTILVDRFKNRLLVLKRTISYQLIGMSSLTDDWGDIRITWNNDPVDNLYTFNAEIINDSNRDAPKNMVITFSVEPGCHFLRQGGILKHGAVTMGLLLENGYVQQFEDVRQRWFAQPVEQRTPGSPIHSEVLHVTRHKKFVVPILNRKEAASFDFLVGSNIPGVPILNIGIYEPGIGLDWYESIERKKRRKLWNQILVTAIYVALIFPIISYSPSITWTAWLMFLNTFVATYFGKWIFYLLKQIRLI